MRDEDIKEFLTGHLQRRGNLPPNFDESTDLIATGVVDSMGIIKFVLEIESRFEIEISDADIEAVRFRTLQGLAAMIAEKSSARCG